MEDFGVAIQWPWVDDQFEVMQTLAQRICEAQRRVIDTETALIFLSRKYPGRARRWSKALWEYEKWLETVYPSEPMEDGDYCEACGRPYDD